MSTDRHAQVKELFLRICDLPEEERQEALDRHCGDDSELRREVGSLLSFHDESEATLAGVAPGGLAAPSREILPERIGEYRVLRKLGEGGMGVVYEVRQDRPVRRRLALKLVKWGMDTKEVLARFESERQALAVMNHPNIAKVFEAGATEQGRPYFTMEYVDGEPITAYCDRHRLNTRERLDLFLQVCDGVQHAHHNGIIHRDIKSSNVLVRVRDDRPVATIIDFGVAKATQQRLTERTLFTERGMLIGTPEYMSPEQAELTGLDVDTRTDVYSLGVVLYELLVGALPFDSKALGAAGFDEIRRRIREDEPSKPSTRVGTLGDASNEAASLRRTDPANLRRELSGDMDWITMKALEKDRTRRYASPAEMAADIARHLDHEPVVAGPPGAVYRIGKFVRRHRLGVTAGAVVALALIVGLALATLGLVRAKRAEREALQEADRANRTSRLLIGMFDGLNRGVPGHVTSIEEILERGVERVEEEMAGEPALQANLLGSLAGAFASIGEIDRGLELTRRTVALCREHLPADHPRRAVSLNLLSQALLAVGDLDGAEEALEEALEVWKRAYDPDTVSVSLGRTHQILGRIRLRKGDFHSARTHLDRAEEILERYTGTFSIHLGYTLFWQAILDMEGYQAHRAALPRLEAALEIFEKEFGRDFQMVGNCLFWSGRAHHLLGDREAARRLYDRALSRQLSGQGPDGPGVAMAKTGLAEILIAEKEHDRAREYLEDALPILERTLGTENPDTARTVRALATVFRLSGRIADARSLLERNLEDMEEGLGPEHPELTRTLHHLGYLELKAGNLERSRRWYRRTLEIQEKAWGSGNPVNVTALYQLACIASLEGEPEEAIGFLRQALECGYDRDSILDDPDLAILRGTPAFEEIVAEVRRRLNAARAADPEPQDQNR